MTGKFVKPFTKEGSGSVPSYLSPVKLHCLFAFSAVLIALSGVPMTNKAQPSCLPPADYSLLRDRILAQGRAVATRIKAGDAVAIFARFSPGMKRAVPQEKLKTLLTQILASGPLTTREGESVHPASKVSDYVTSLRQGDHVLHVQVVFDRASLVSGLLLSLRPALPPDPQGRYRTKTRLRLPFEGQWWVFWGGNTEAQNYHVVAHDQRHAYDFCVWRQGGTHSGAGTRNSDYWAWGRSVLAPASAVVVEAVDGLPDNTPGRMDPTHPAGNHVVLDFGNGEYGLIAHLQRGSVRVHPGDPVQARQELGLCGNSGNSSEPHVHMHLQDRAKLFGDAVGLPLTFTDYRADGRFVLRGVPIQGQFVCDGN